MSLLRFLLPLALVLPGPLRAEYVLENAAVPDIPREFRAAWIACVYNLDWPSAAGLPAAKQQAELDAILDRMQSLGLNAVILQVRPACDAAYASTLEPWSASFSGTMGKSPGYDPLACALAEAHRRGLELHAWLNPFRALAGKHPAAASHLTRQHPEWVRTYGSQKWIDPAEPKARQHVLAVVTDILRRYDVDGIHIDDYFYPYPIRDASGGIVPFPDDATFTASGSSLSRGDWRRANIDSFVQTFYTTAKTVRPAAKVGISPFGIWRPNVPAGIEARLDAWEHLAADSRKWLREGWCDYFTPQLYWRIDPKPQGFSALLTWWRGENEKKRHLWPGIATGRIDSSEDPGRPAAEILRQIDLCRSGASPGHCQWSVKSLVQNRGGIARQLSAGPFSEKALPPASPWLPGKAAAAPPVTIVEEAAGLLFKWTPVSEARWAAVQERTGGKWTLAATAFSAAGELRLKQKPDAVALRFVAANGLLFPALHWVRR